MSKLPVRKHLPYKLQHLWCGEINSGHVIAFNASSKEQILTYRHLGTNESTQVELNAGESFKFQISRSSQNSPGFEIKASGNVEIDFIEGGNLTAPSLNI